MSLTFPVYGQDPATDVVEELGTFTSDGKAMIFAEETCGKMAERMIANGLKDVRWISERSGWRYEVWAGDALAYVVTVEEVEPEAEEA